MSYYPLSWTDSTGNSFYWTTKNFSSASTTTLSSYTSTNSSGDFWGNGISARVANGIQQFIKKATEQDRTLVVLQGGEFKLQTPDGSEIVFDAKGNFSINDKEAKILYKANRNREFNPYVNASDLMEEFLQYVGKLGIHPTQILELPIELFIKFLVLRAAEQDGEDATADQKSLVQALPAPKVAPTCLWCRHFLPFRLARQGIEFCSGLHLDSYRHKYPDGRQSHLIRG